MDDVSRLNASFWSRLVAADFVYTRPWLDLDPVLLRDFAAGRVDALSEPYAYLYPRECFAEVAGRRVLCLATGGGQQSAVFGLLGAEVTVLDVCEEQLEGDRRAASHYGYPLRALRGDMRDLSRFPDGSFDLVYQAISICFVPAVREVYREAARVLRPGGHYRVGHNVPGTPLVGEESWTGEGYLVREPYRPGRIDDDECAEYQHSFADIFNGLVECGLEIRGVWEDPRHLHHDRGAKPGTTEHLLTMLPSYFAILTRK